MDFKAPENVSVLLSRAGVHTAHPCGGRGVCGKCKVGIEGAVSEPDLYEKKAGFRLSCRAAALGDLTVTVPESGEILVEGAETSDKNTKSAAEYATGKYTAAVDIGTTTLVVHILNEDGDVVSEKGILNPQEEIAADVMGRIGAALSGKLPKLQEMIREAILNLIKEQGLEGRIERYVITGNTTMLYLFEGRNPEKLSKYPFEADELYGRTLDFNGVPAFLPLCMHAFVGADIMTAVLYSGMCSKKETALLCDVGTNGEIALWHEGTLYVTSTAAGPAFEGAGISCGCQGIPGAIEKVWEEDGKISYQTIGNLPPAGICGSGLIDAVATALSLELIDETGAIDDEITLTDTLKLTQKDIRNVQLAKAAICAGILTVSEFSGVSLDKISTFYIAGGFGAHLDVTSACAIGLFPKELQKKAEILGNAALKGAEELIRKPELTIVTDFIKNVAVHVNLGGDSSFNDYYIEQMMFE